MENLGASSFLRRHFIRLVNNIINIRFQNCSNGGICGKGGQYTYWIGCHKQCSNQFIVCVYKHNVVIWEEYDIVCIITEVVVVVADDDNVL